MPRLTYVLYARKSTESEDRQVLSIDSQVRELQLLATRQGFAVAEVLTESKSAKSPGRPVFGELMRRVERGQIAGLLCWKAHFRRKLGKLFSSLHAKSFSAGDDCYF